MTTHTHVPADIEAGSIIDLIEDCREISGVLGNFVPTVIRIPAPRSVLPVDISALTAAGLEGYGEYGS